LKLAESKQDSMAGSAGHRATLKQKNKGHNHGKHRSKRNLKRENQGKVNVKELTKKKKVKDLLRSEAAQRHASGRDDAYDQIRGTTSSAPRFVVVVSLDKAVDIPAVLELLKEADISAEVKTSERNTMHISAPKLKKRMCFSVVEYGNHQGLLDATRAADVVLFLMSGDRGMDSYGDYCLTCVVAQGVPAHVFACQGLTDLSKKKLSDAKKRCEKLVEKSFPGEKPKSIDNWQDGQSLWRHMSNLALKPVHFRDTRPYLVAERLEYVENTSDMDPAEFEIGKGTLKLSGYVRGESLDVNQLVHLPGLGDYQMTQIDQIDDPFPLGVVGNKDRRGENNKVAGDAEMTEAVPRGFCLAKANKPETLQSEIVPDDMDQEQTWPTAEELGEDKPVKTKTLKGMSDYQSNWITDLPDGEDDSDDSDDDDMDDEGMDDGEGSDDEEEETNETDDTATEKGDAENYDDEMDMDEEKKMYEKMKEERSHVHFPDEIDTPIDSAARNRFARYRGMDSFNTTVWDPNECLPYEYGRIYRVSKHHYKRLKKISVQEREEVGDNLLAEPGCFVTVYVKNIEKHFYDAMTPNTPVTMYGLFPNEQKMTLMSVQLARAPGFTAPLKSKEPMVFQIGFRRFSACPIFSDHSNQNKFKMERFLPDCGTFIVASMYAPIMFAPAPVLAFRENALEKFDLVAKGSLMSLDTNRIVVKRVVLSGMPFKINKRSTTVRYMFFNREDIEFYKPIELRTKYGKRGHIKQTLGTHGHMKCTFNGQLKSEDTILMHLFKRVFPKWTYNPQVSILPPVIKEDDALEDEDEMAEGETRGEAFKMFD